MEQTSKEFAKKVIDLYKEFRGKLNKEDIRTHGMILEQMQDLRDNGKFVTRRIKLK